MSDLLDSPTQSWLARDRQLTQLAMRQLFFVGGAPRSGTTWLQQLLDNHPDVSCRGEGIFGSQLADPLDSLIASRNVTLDQKNARLFAHTGGYPLASNEDAGILLGTGVLLAMSRQLEGRDCSAVGEKTPENVFLFRRLQTLFPKAKFIGIARDPRDVLTSAWHMFHNSRPVKDPDKAKWDMIRNALPSISAGARMMVELRRQNPEACALVTFEGLHSAPRAVMAGLFRFLGVTDQDDVVMRCVDQASFAEQKSRLGGHPSSPAFLRRGVVGDWRSTLSDGMGDLIIGELGWMFPIFGWKL